mmetsp:Transcript_105123/g.128334  ORF Transcript_105123/g.128334 Transcript_105123/m.128334 type:complete len:319 (+) Transcript_105123:1-957(+)
MRLSGGDEKDSNDNNNLNNNNNNDINNEEQTNKLKELFNMGSQDILVQNIRNRIREVLLNTQIDSMFLDQYRNSLKAYLYHVRDWAKKKGNIKVLNDAEQAISGVNKYITKQHNAQLNDTNAFNQFLLQYVNEIREVKRRADRFHLKVIAVAKARDTIIDHANYLQTKLEYYQQYLKNVQENTTGKKKKKKKDNNNNNRRNNRKKDKPVKYGHKKLYDMGVIVGVDEDVLRQTKANFNNLVYYFSQTGPDEFEVEVKYRVGFGAKISPFPEPFQLSLSKLLEMRESHQARYQLEMVTLQVNLLINLLNNDFVKGKAIQ